MRQKILDEIRRIAAENGGRSPGQEVFVKNSGYAQSDWLGRYWARWSDAVKEAGLEPNSFNGKSDSEFLLQKLAEATRHYGHFPTSPERKLYKQFDPEFPSHGTFDLNFGTKEEMTEKLRAWATAKPEFSGIVELLPSGKGAVKSVSVKASDGWVYLIKFGPHHKIGRGEELERRVRQVQVALPDKGELVHAIRTDDPSGIEAYWHRRFADRRANGEWFKLTVVDVAAFKRRKFQ